MTTDARSRRIGGDIARRLMLYGEMHRFVPVIAAELGARIAEQQVNFRPRRTGHSKYGPGRIVRTVLDLLTVRFLSGYSTRPIQVFGAIGVFLSGLGSVWTAVLVFEKVILGWPLGNRPALVAGGAAGGGGSAVRQPRADWRNDHADLSRIAEQADLCDQGGILTTR